MHHFFSICFVVPRLIGWYSKWDKVQIHVCRVGSIRGVTPLVHEDGSRQLMLASVVRNKCVLVSVMVMLFVGQKGDVHTKPVLAYIMFKTIGDILPKHFDSSVR